jgi:hypothetical protein
MTVLKMQSRAERLVFVAEKVEPDSPAQAATQEARSMPAAEPDEGREQTVEKPG